jgi:hypothetical protein
VRKQDRDKEELFIATLDFQMNRLTDFQHAYKGRSTCTALTQMTDDWLKEIDNKKIVGGAQLDFSADFDIIDHNLLLRKSMLAFQPLPYCGFRAIYLISQRIFFIGIFSNVKHVKCRAGIATGQLSRPSSLFNFYQ